MKYSRALFITLLIAIFATIAFSQQTFTNGGQNRPGNNERLQVLRELGLSRTQIQQIRRINQETRPLKNQAGQRLRKARQELNEAIYADQVNENEISTTVRAVAEAQAEVTKINARHELKVRQVLTPAQLVRFREMRANFAARRKANTRQPLTDRNRRLRRNRPVNQNKRAIKP